MYAVIAYLLAAFVDLIRIVQNIAGTVARLRLVTSTVEVTSCMRWKHPDGWPSQASY
jgi:hypothetical protein